MTIKLSVVWIALFPGFTLACDLFDPPYASDNDSVMFHSPAGVCFSFQEGVDYATEKLEQLSLLSEDPQDDAESEYWNDWITLDDTNPLLTQSLESNYFGVGIWLPSEVEDRMHDMQAGEWIINHGLQFSVGLGDKQAGKPRMRFDYRWHNQYDGDVLMQVEVPF
ncbi:hypothetical protein [Vibrio proteolyticus]